MTSSFDEIFGRATLYAGRRGVLLGSRLGFGKDGSVFSLLPGAGTIHGVEVPSAIKVFVRPELCEREHAVYRRLADVGVGGVVQVCGHNVPVMLDYDPELWVIRMTVVARPFVLDFAGAYIDEPPEFPADVMEERCAHWADIFEHRWPAVQRIMTEFRRLGVFLLDPSPGNIGFVEN